MKRLIGFLAGFLSLVFLNAVFADGTVQFANNSSTRITNCLTRLPQARGTIKIGLYCTVDLSAVSNVSARASMVLVAVTTNRVLDGIFSGGIVFIPFVSPDTYVVLQAKAWPTNYSSYEAALADGADVSECPPWVQKVGGTISPPTIITRWGFRPFLFPQCEPPRVPLALEKSGGKLRVVWPIGPAPDLQVNDGSGTNWQALTSGTFVTDHWEFDVPATNAVQFYRLAR